MTGRDSDEDRRIRAALRELHAANPAPAFDRVIRGAPARDARRARWGLAVGFAVLAFAILLVVYRPADEHAPPEELLEASAELDAMEQWSAPFDDLLVLPGDDIVSAAPPESPFPVPDLDPFGEKR